MQAIVPPVTPLPPVPEGTPGEPILAWNKTYENKGQDIAYAVVKAKDGYVMAGDSNNDIALVKTDLKGNQVWRKLHGGKGTDTARSIIAVDDGYIVAGSSNSYENFGVYDVYLLKTDFDGNMVWYKTYSYMRRGVLTNTCGKGIVAADGGYVIAGDANADINGGPDIYLLKTDLNGTQVWNKTFGGDADDHGNAIVALPDGFVIAGDTKSSGIEAGDVYLLKTDLSGNEVWNRTFGGKNEDFGNALAAVDDGFIIAGGTKSFGNTSKYDVYLVKTGPDGKLSWEKNYGKADDDQGKAVVSAGDGYVVAGYTSTIGNFYKDIYVFEAGPDGDLVWDRSYGGPDLDEANAIVRDGEDHVIAGYKSTYGIFNADFCLLKVQPYVMPTPVPTVTAEPSIPAPTAAGASAQAGGLSSTDMVILVVATIAIVGIAGAVVAALYLFPKK